MSNIKTQKQELKQEISSIYTKVKTAYDLARSAYSDGKITPEKYLDQLQSIQRATKTYDYMLTKGIKLQYKQANNEYLKVRKEWDAYSFANLNMEVVSDYKAVAVDKGITAGWKETKQIDLVIEALDGAVVKALSKLKELSDADEFKKLILNSLSITINDELKNYLISKIDTDEQLKKIVLGSLSISTYAFNDFIEKAQGDIENKAKLAEIGLNAKYVVTKKLVAPTVTSFIKTLPEEKVDKYRELAAKLEKVYAEESGESDE